MTNEKQELIPLDSSEAGSANAGDHIPHALQAVAAAEMVQSQRQRKPHRRGSQAIQAAADDP